MLHIPRHYDVQLHLALVHIAVTVNPLRHSLSTIPVLAAVKTAIVRTELCRVE